MASHPPLDQDTCSCLVVRAVLEELESERSKRLDAEMQLSAFQHEEEQALLPSKINNDRNDNTACTNSNFGSSSSNSNSIPTRMPTLCPPYIAHEVNSIFEESKAKAIHKRNLSPVLTKIFEKFYSETIQEVSKQQKQHEARK